MYGYVYITINKINNKRYVGKKYGNFDNRYYGSGILIKQAIEKYGIENFECEILKECCDENELNFFEKHFIQEMIPEYNLAEGGTGGNTLFFMQDEDKKNIIEKRKKSLSKKWSVISEEKRKEWGKAISEAKKGKSYNRKNFKHSEETKKKISNANKGWHNEDWKKNHELAMKKRKGVPNFKCFKQVEIDGVVYQSMKEACEKLDISFPTLKKRIYNEKEKNEE